MKSIVIGMGIVILILVGYIIYVHEYRDTKNHAEIVYWKDKAFKPDTIFSNTTLKETLNLQPIYRDSVPPKQVIIYKYEYPPGYLDFKDGMVSIIDSLKKTSTPVNPDFIIKHPGAPKLISALFQKDSLRLDLLTAQGSEKSEYYLVDYNSFKYQYLNNSMRASEVKTSKSNKATNKKFIDYNGTYINYKHDLLHADHQVEIETNLKLWRLKFGLFGQYPLAKPNTLDLSRKPNAGVKVGVLLF